MTLSVIIPAYNDLRGCLKALKTLQTTARDAHQYIVSDDCSSDVDFTEVVSPTVAEVYRNDHNGGFAFNCNMGASHATGDILLFVNQDVYAHPDWSTAWDAALLRAFDHADVGIVGARLLFPGGEIQSAGGLFDARCTPFHRSLGWSNCHHPDVSTPREVSWCTGAAMAIRRDLFAQLGGFDTAYGRGYFEDADICCRVRELGYKVWYEPHATFFHGVGSTGGNPDFLKNALLFKNRWVDSGKVKPDVNYVGAVYW